MIYSYLEINACTLQYQAISNAFMSFTSPVRSLSSETTLFLPRKCYIFLHSPFSSTGFRAFITTVSANSIFIGLFLIQLFSFCSCSSFWALLFLSDDALSESQIQFRISFHFQRKLVIYHSRYTIRELSFLLYLAHFQKKNFRASNVDGVV